MRKGALDRVPTRRHALSKHATKMLGKFDPSEDVLWHPVNTAYLLCLRCQLCYFVREIERLDFVGSNGVRRVEERLLDKLIKTIAVMASMVRGQGTLGPFGGLVGHLALHSALIIHELNMEVEKVWIKPGGFISAMKARGPKRRHAAQQRLATSSLEQTEPALTHYRLRQVDWGFSINNVGDINTQARGVLAFHLLCVLNNAARILVGIRHDDFITVPAYDGIVVRQQAGLK